MLALAMLGLLGIIYSGLSIWVGTTLLGALLVPVATGSFLTSLIGRKAPCFFYFCLFGFLFLDIGFLCVIALDVLELTL